MTIAYNYYIRDIEMKLEPKRQIVNALYKLGYLNLDIDKKCKTYIDSEISLMMLNDTNLLTFYVDVIKETDKYKSYYNHLLYSQKRFNELKDFLSIDNIDFHVLKEFYESCTEEELMYLGW